VVDSTSAVVNDDTLANNKCKAVSRKVSERNIFTVCTGTNAPMGERPVTNAKKRVAETVLQIESWNVAFPTKWQITIQGGTKVSEHTTKSPSEILIRLFGDSEARTFIRVLRTSLEILERQYATEKRRLENGTKNTIDIS
jgi:hypothetical protein